MRFVEMRKNANLCTVFVSTARERRRHYVIDEM